LRVKRRLLYFKANYPILLLPQIFRLNSYKKLFQKLKLWNSPT
jgi:hypothetical protein